MEQYFFDQDKPDIESSIFSSLERLSEIFKLNLWKNNRNDNLSFLQVKILTIIKNNENTTVSHITETLKMSKSTISISISNLEKKGYISKEKNRADFRVVNLFLTDKGKEFLTKINGSVEDIKNNLKELPKAKQEDILKSLLVLIHSLGQSISLDADSLCFSCFYYEDRNEPFCRMINKNLKDSTFPESWYTKL